MKRILCFGDSNTWGYDPETDERYDNKTRWPCVMANILGDEFDIVEEGMNGRTTVWDDPVDDLMSGINYLKPCLISHKPLDLVIVMLGTNDLKDRFCVSAYEIAKSAGRLVQMIQSSEAGPQGRAPQVLLIAPPPIVLGDSGLDTRQHGLEKSKQFAEEFAATAELLGCGFANAGDFIESSLVDGIHFSAESQRQLGESIAKVVSDQNRG